MVSPTVSTELLVWPSIDGRTPSGDQPMARYDEPDLLRWLDAMRRAKPGYQFVIEERTITTTCVFKPLSVTKEAIAQHAAKFPPKIITAPALTPRMRDIVRLIGDGRTNKEIAQFLNLSVKTIETHRMNLMARLGVHNTAGIVRYALQAGLTN